MASSGKSLALGDQQLQADQVEGGDLLGHGMLDLEPGVHLEEEELAAVVEKLDGAGSHVAHRAGRGDRGFAHLLAGGLIDHRRGGLLDDLLMAPLNRALALEHRHHVAVGVAENLDLDMPRRHQVAFEEDGVVAEGGPGFAAGAGRPPRADPSGPATIRMPLPPPPAEALTSTGYPICLGRVEDLIGVEPGQIDRRQGRDSGRRRRAASTRALTPWQPSPPETGRSR